MTWIICSRANCADTLTVTQIGLQTFTVRRHLKTPGAIDTAFERLAGMGLRAVELAYVKLKPAYINALAAAGNRHNIRFASSQITFSILDQQRDWVVRFHRQLGCTSTAVSVLPWTHVRGSRDRLLTFAERLEALGQWYRERGIQLCFHHHDFEFRRYGNTTGLQVILNNTSAKNLSLELDTYWAQRGGFTPQALISSLGDRVRVVHLRDYSVRNRLIAMQPFDTELGAGNLDLSAIIQTCCEHKVDLLAIEQNTATPYPAVARSIAHLRHLGFGHLLEASGPGDKA